MPNKPFTKKELEILTTTEDKNNINLPNRSKKSIRRKLILLGLIKPNFKIKHHSKKRWSADEIEKLKSIKDPRKFTERSRQSIFRKAIRLGIIEKKPYKKPWENKNVETLISLVQKGKSPSQIFKMGVLPHSRNSIQKKIKYLRLNSEYKILELKKNEEEIKNSGKSIKIIEDALKMNRANLMRERISSKRDIWTGLPLENQDAIELNQTDI